MQFYIQCREELVAMHKQFLSFIIKESQVTPPSRDSHLQHYGVFGVLTLNVFNSYIIM